jgi:hypothetical protein
VNRQELKGVLNKQKSVLFLFFGLYHFLCQLCDRGFYSPRIASLDEPVAFYTVRILPPDVFVLLSPATHQIRADKDISSALVTSDEMTPADIEHPYFMTEPAFDISEKVAIYKVICFCHSNHILSRSMIRPFLI